MINRRTLLSAAATAGAAIGLGISPPDRAFADNYPSRPIKLVVPFAAGGPLDFVSRLVAEKMSDSLKQPIVIENREGAGGNVGDAVVARAVPDGYTLLFTLSTALTVNPLIYEHMAFDPRKDLRPISLLVRDSQMLVVHPSVPVNSVAEFVAMARKDPITYAHAGFGSPGHLTMSYFALKAGFRGIGVPFKGNAPLVTALLGGQVETAFVATAGVLPHVRAGRLKGLAISGEERRPLAPNVPTIAESGYPGFHVETEFVLLAPAGTPDLIVTRVEREARAALRAPDVQKRIAALNMTPVASTAAEAIERIAADATLWQAIVAAAGMHAQ